VDTDRPTATHWPPFVEDPGAKGYRQGTHRLSAPESTLARLRPLLPAMGITRVANITGLDTIGIPVVVAVRPNARGLAVSQGKGLDLAAAKVSALMETVEAHHAERIIAPLILSSYDDLRQTHRVVDVAKLPQVSDRTFHPRLDLLWIEGYDLLQSVSVWLPYELVHANFTLPLPSGSGSFPLTTNGLASGNHPLEAISHGLCEVVERDATALWLQSDREVVQASRIDLTTVDDACCREALEKFDRAGVAVAVWETTTTIGIPCFFCGIIDRTDDPLRPLHPAGGAGCHPCRSIALLRALTEAAQSRLTIISGSRDDVFREDYEEVHNDHTIQESRLFAAEVQDGMRRFRDGPNWDGETFAEDVVWELDRLRAEGIDRVIVVDLTKPEIRLPVVRVVIPGLEGPTQLSTYLPGPRALARRRSGT
jgi:YcaO-like protein with predicted kinase domain